MKLIDPLEFRPDRAWAALEIAQIDGVTVRLHWTDRPYKWHVNDGAEVLVVLSGELDMHHREGSKEGVARLKAGEIFYAAQGDEHFASPIGEVRILVIERAGSV
jgi:mannose-6-phosphate isomerase-like protein (cupin superfamily)